MVDVGTTLNSELCDLIWIMQNICREIFMNHSLSVKFIFYYENATYTVENFRSADRRGVLSIGLPILWFCSPWSYNFSGKNFLLYSNFTESSLSVVEDCVAVLVCSSLSQLHCGGPPHCDCRETTLWGTCVCMCVCTCVHMCDVCSDCPNPSCLW